MISLTQVAKMQNRRGICKKRLRHMLKTVTVLQKALTACNETDPITLEPISDIEPNKLFIVRSSNGRSKFAFDGEALLEYMIQEVKFSNPLSREPFNNQDLLRLAQQFSKTNTIRLHATKLLNTLGPQEHAHPIIANIKQQLADDNTDQSEILITIKDASQVIQRERSIARSTRFYIENEALKIFKEWIRFSKIKYMARVPVEQCVQYWFMYEVSFYARIYVLRLNGGSQTDVTSLLDAARNILDSKKFSPKYEPRTMNIIGTQLGQWEQRYQHYMPQFLANIQLFLGASLPLVLVDSIKQQLRLREQLLQQTNT